MDFCGISEKATLGFRLPVDLFFASLSLLNELHIACFFRLVKHTSMGA